MKELFRLVLKHPIFFFFSMALGLTLFHMDFGALTVFSLAMFVRVMFSCAVIYLIAWLEEAEKFNVEDKHKEAVIL